MPVEQDPSENRISLIHEKVNIDLELVKNLSVLREKCALLLQRKQKQQAENVKQKGEINNEYSNSKS